jgi:hypothetical protein
MAMTIVASTRLLTLDIWAASDCTELRVELMELSELPMAPTCELTELRVELMELSKLLTELSEELSEL